MSKKQLFAPLALLLALSACDPEILSEDDLTQDVSNALDARATTIEAVPTEIASELRSELNALYSRQEVVRLKAHNEAASCFASASSTPPTQADLIIYFNDDKGYSGLQKVANCFTSDTGYRIAVQAPSSLPTTFENNPAAVDIVIWPHDRYGDWADTDLLAQVTPSADVLKSIPAELLEAVTFNNKLYGYPIAIEGPVLLTNRALLSQPITAIEQISALMLDDSVTPMAWDYNNSYFTRGFLLAGEAYEFALTDSGWSGTDSNVNDADAVDALETIKGLIDSQHIAPITEDDIGYTVMDSGFKNGEAAMIINGPWAFKDYTEAGIDFTISKYPTINGNESEPYTGVLSAGISAHSTEQDVAKAFIEQYLLTEEGLATIDADRSLGVPANIGLLVNKAKEDQQLAEFAAALSDSMPMPNIPEMGKYWSNMDPALTGVFNGSSAATNALNAVQTKLEAD